MKISLPKNKFKLSLWFLTIVTSLVNLGYFVATLWDIYAISTDRNGMAYQFYIYMKDVSKADVLYHLNIILLSSFLIILIQLAGIVNYKNWINIFSIILFIFFLIGFNKYQNYLAFQWVGKG